jgi:hypothetical protein
MITPQDPLPQPPSGTSHAFAPPALKPKGRPFAIVSIVIGVVGILPMLVYFISCIGHFDSAYRTGGNPLLILAMGFIGLIVHGIGLTSGILGACMACKKLSLIGIIGNAMFLCGILLFGFIAIAGA